MPGSYKKQKTGINKSLNAFTKKGNGNGAGVAAQPRAREIRPDQVIPFDEGDFKQF